MRREHKADAGREAWFRYGRCPATRQEHGQQQARDLVEQGRTRAEIIRLLDVSRSTWRAWIASGAVPRIVQVAA